MAKIIGLSGPQGGGKSTLLNGLKTKDIIVDDFKVSREVQKRLGWTSLDNVYTKPETMMAFQNMIMEVKRERELDNLERADAELILTERTFADIATYTHMWSSKLLEKEMWGVQDAIAYVVKFARECADSQWLYVGNLYLPSMPHIPWEDDPHRAKKEDIQEFELQISEFFDSWHPEEVPVFTIVSASVEDRVKEAETWIKDILQ